MIPNLPNLPQLPVEGDNIPHLPSLPNLPDLPPVPTPASIQENDGPNENNANGFEELEANGLEIEILKPKKKRGGMKKKGKPGKLNDEDNLQDEEVKAKVKKEFEENIFIPKDRKEQIIYESCDPLRVIVSNLPLNITAGDLNKFFDTLLISINTSLEDIIPISSISFSQSRTYAVLEMANQEALNTILELASVDLSGSTLKITRPLIFYRKMYKEGNLGEHGMSIMTEMENKIYIGGIPTYVTEEDIKKVCEQFGQIKNFQMAKDVSTNGETFSKGYCFVEYVNPKSNEKATIGLNGLQVGHKKLKVQKASLFEPLKQIDTRTPSNNTGKYINSHPMINNPLVRMVLDIPRESQVPSTVIQLLNMFSVEDLFERDELDILKADLNTEARAYGEIDDIEIPMPDEKGQCVPGVGKVFIKYQNVLNAKIARYRINGKNYNGRTVVASYYPEVKFHRRDYLLDANELKMRDSSQMEMEKVGH